MHIVVVFLRYVRPSGEAVTIHRRRRTLPARSAPEESDVDDNDLFFEVMHEPLGSQQKEASTSGL